MLFAVFLLLHELEYNGDTIKISLISSTSQVYFYSTFKTSADQSAAQAETKSKSEKTKRKHAQIKVWRGCLLTHLHLCIVALCPLQYFLCFFESSAELRRVFGRWELAVIRLKYRPHPITLLEHMYIICCHDITIHDIILETTSNTLYLSNNQLSQIISIYV